MATWDDISTPVQTAAATPPAGDASPSPSAGGDTQYAAVDPIARNIAGIESGGDYTKLGPTTHTGDRAIGKYQIMGANVPAWTQEALGKAMTPDEFHRNPDAQEQTAKFQLKKLYDKYGNARDVASVWHSGVPYDQAVKEGRADQLGTTTQSYADRVASGASSTPDDPWSAISDPVSPGPGAESTTTVTPTSSTTPPSQKSMRQQSMDEAAATVNRGFGQPADHWAGRYTVAFGKPLTDAVSDFIDGAAKISNPAELPNLLQNLIKIASPLAVPGQALGEAVYQAGTDAKLDPGLVAGLATAASLGMGALTPLPGGKAAPATPLQGSTAARAAATEAEAAAARGEQWAGAARTEAETKAQDAAAAASATPPAPATRPEATAALAPAEVTPAQGAQAVEAGLQQGLKEVKDPVQGIYKAVEENAANAGLGVDPGKYQQIHQQLSAIKDELGTTLTGPAKDVIDGILGKLDRGEKLTFADLAPYKSQLDTLFPGKTPLGATPRTAALYQFKWDVRKMMSDLLTGDDKNWFDAANAMWRDQVIPRQTRLALVQKSDPAVVIERLFGNGTTDKQATIAGQIFRDLGENSAHAEALRQGIASRMIAGASDAEKALKPKDLLRAYDAMQDDYRAAVFNPGAQQFFQKLRADLAAGPALAAEAKTAAGTAAAAEKTASAAESLAAKGRAAAASARATAQAPNTLAKLTSKGLEFAVLEGMAGAVDQLFPGAGNAMRAGGAIRLLLPADRLADALANSTTANALARALYLPANSALVPTTLKLLQQKGLIHREPTP